MATVTYKPYYRVQQYFNPKLGGTSSASSYKALKDNMYKSPYPSKRTRPKSLYFSPTDRTTEQVIYTDLPKWITTYNGQGQPDGSLFVSSEEVSGNLSRPGSGVSTSFVDKPMKGNELLLKIKEEKINLAMLLAEYRETIDMFISSAMRLANLYRQMRRGNIPGFVTTAKQYVRRKTYRDDWMLYRYGVVPFMSDAEAMFKLLMEGLNKELVKRFSVYEGKELRADYAWGGTNAKSMRMSNLYLTSAKQVAWVEYESTILGSLSQVGLMNPVQLAWEVIPFSFVADWFLSIGDVLSSLDALSGVKRVAITRNVRGCCRTRYDYVWGMDVTSFESGWARRDTRTVLTPNQLRSLNWDPSINWKRLLDSIALLSQNKPHVRI